MKSTTIVCALAAAALGFGSLSQAQGWDRGQDREGRRGGWDQGRGGQQPDGGRWQRGQGQVQVQPQQPRPIPPQGQWGQQRRGGERRDGAGQPPQFPAQGQYPRYGIPPQGYVQPAPPQGHYGYQGRSPGYVQTPPPQWQSPGWQNQYRADDGHRAERGAWRQAPRFRRGDYLPPEYRHHYVQDWRAHRLYAPPAGYQWVEVDTGDYLLIAIGTGLIANLLLGQ